MLRILIIDDEESILKALHRIIINHAHLISHDGLTVDTFTSPLDVLAMGRQVTYHLAIVDYRMPEMNGVEFLSAFRRLQPLATRIMMSGYSDMTSLMSAINEAHIFQFIEKPWQASQILSTLIQSLNYNKLLLENQRLADQVRMQERQLRKRELELKRLEQECPGITKVNWTPDGSILLEEEGF